MDKMKDLVEQLNTYRDAYYNDNISIISDKEYDALFDKLKKMEDDSGIIYGNSPTQTVGYEVKSELTKVTHNHPMLSLDKTQEIAELASFFKGKESVIMAKADGLTCSLLYRNGTLVSAESRGNGLIGEDVTHNAKVFANLPKTIPFKGELIVDGEAVITYEAFNKINKPLIEKATVEAIKLGLNEDEKQQYIKEHSYKNPRNLASGSVRQLDSKIASEREIRFFAWKLERMLDEKGNSIIPDKFSERLTFIHNQGFDVIPFAVIPSGQTMAPVTAMYELVVNTVVAQCKDISIPIDGIVGTFEDAQYGITLGMTGHHPRHSIAYKFYQEENETVLLDIAWQTSRTGLVNPVAILKPVEIDGTTVSRASLSNVSVIKDLELGIGDTVSVIKANQIIPKITDNNTRSNSYVIPTECPSCGGALRIHSENGRETLNCDNPECGARKLDKLVNFVSREGMNVVGLSAERLRVFSNLGFVKEFEDVYTLYRHSNELCKMEGFGENSIDKILAAIENSKKCSFANVLVAIGITKIGKSGAKAITNHIRSMNTGDIFTCFMDLCKNKYDWSVIDDFGEITSQNINSYVNENWDKIAKLKTHLHIEENETGYIISDVLANYTFCITGKLLQFPNRDALVAEIESNGGKVVSGVTAKTNYLITNDKNSGSSKNKKAIEYGTKIINEVEFLALIGK